MTTLSGILDAYEASIKPDKPIPALQGAFIAGAYQTTVASDPSLVYVRMLDNTVTRAKHRNRLNLTDPNQNIPIALYYDEYDQLSVWGIEPNQAGAVLQGSPVAGAGGVKSVVAGANVTVNNTDPVNPIVSALTGGGSGLVFIQTADLSINNSSAEQTLFGTGSGSKVVDLTTAPVVVEFSIYGYYSVLAGGTVTFSIYLNTTLMLASFAITPPDDFGALWFKGTLTLRDNDGSSAHVVTYLEPSLTPEPGAASANVIYGSIGVSTIDLGAGITTQTLDARIQFSVADAGNAFDTFESFIRVSGL